MIHIKLDPDSMKSRITDDHGNVLPVSSVNVAQSAGGPSVAYFKIEMIHLIAAVELGDCNGEFDDRTVASLKRLPSKVLHQLGEDLLAMSKAKRVLEDLVNTKDLSKQQKQETGEP